MINISRKIVNSNKYYYQNSQEIRRRLNLKITITNRLNFYVKIFFYSFLDDPLNHPLFYAQKMVELSQKIYLYISKIKQKHEIGQYFN